jgi:hypothetical protein
VQLKSFNKNPSFCVIILQQATPGDQKDTVVYLVTGEEDEKVELDES